jgi:hypothetical protein
MILQDNYTKALATGLILTLTIFLTLAFFPSIASLLLLGTMLALLAKLGLVFQNKSTPRVWSIFLVINVILFAALLQSEGILIWFTNLAISLFIAALLERLLRDRRR